MRDSSSDTPKGRVERVLWCVRRKTLRVSGRVKSSLMEKQLVKNILYFLFISLYLSCNSFNYNYIRINHKHHFSLGLLVRYKLLYGS